MPRSNKNFNKSSKELALEQIYIFNKRRFPEDRVKIKDPVSLSIISADNLHEDVFVNIDVDDDFDCRFSKKTEAEGFIYRRFNINILTYGIDFSTLNFSYPFTTYGILPRLNTLLNAQLTEQDILDDIYPDATKTFKLRVNPRSLIWFDVDQNEVDIELYRILENGAIRLLEDGSYRLME
jgi:hypothetical protein